MRKTVHISVRGTRYYKAAESWKKRLLKPGSRIRLVHEPDNPHDENAVAVHLASTGEMLGHIPRELAQRYASLLNSGCILEVTVESASRSLDGVKLLIQILYDEPQEQIFTRQNSVFFKSALSLPHTAGVYGIRNIENGCIYVGSSNNLRRRAQDHLRALFTGSHSNIPLQKDFDRFGCDKFEFMLLAENVLPSSLRMMIEEGEIQRRKNDGQLLYNLTENGQGSQRAQYYPGEQKTISDRIERFERESSEVAQMLQQVILDKQAEEKAKMTRKLRGLSELSIWSWLFALSVLVLLLLSIPKCHK